jgi:hypothetical protein
MPETKKNPPTKLPKADGIKLFHMKYPKVEGAPYIREGGTIT